MLSNTLYLDYAATTPLDRRVADHLHRVQLESFANPASNHRLGWQSDAVVGTAAREVAALLGADKSQFTWTSGATESNNLAIIGAAQQRAHRGKHLITMRTEHKAVVDVFVALQKQGFDVTWLLPQESGVLALEDLRAAFRDDTQLVSIMHINNETGAVQDIAAIGAVCREHGALYHCDGAQSVGKVPLNLAQLPIDLLSLTAHKFYGPNGIGALYIGDGVQIQPLLYGGAQQRRLRPGTVPVDLAAGLGAAARIAQQDLSNDYAHLVDLRAAFLQRVRDLDGVRINGDPTNDFPGILNISCADVEGESLLLALEPLCVATGSACNSQSQEPSYVLRAMGCSDTEAESAIRFSFGRSTTLAEVQAAADHYCAAVSKLRQINAGLSR